MFHYVMNGMMILQTLCMIILHIISISTGTSAFTGPGSSTFHPVHDVLNQQHKRFLLSPVVKNNRNDNNDTPSSSSSSSTSTTASMIQKEALLNLLSQVTPNEATTSKLTNQILNSVSELELYCPTQTESVLKELNGNWELIWTAQDRDSKEVSGSRGINNGSLFGTWINPLENQSYSNNPFGVSRRNSKSRRQGGRSNPILPQSIQNKLENIGILVPNDDANYNSNKNNNNNDYDENDNESVVKSSQAIDLNKGRVRNVVSVMINNPLSSFSLLPNETTRSTASNKKDAVVRGSLTVDVNFKPNKVDKRKIDVKFNECRVTLRDSPLDVRIPLGPMGPTGKCLFQRNKIIERVVFITHYITAFYALLCTYIM